MIARINRVITWNGKEYAHIIEERFDQFCDACAFFELCNKVISGELSPGQSPMKICQQLTDELDIHTAFFMDASKAEDYIQRVNKNS